MTLDVPVLLVDTSDPNHPGSMRRHAALTESILRTHGVRVIRVASEPGSSPLSSLGSVGLSNALRLRHIELALTLPAQVRNAIEQAGEPCLIHLLDGSYGYLLNLLPTSLACCVTVHDLIPYLQIDGALPGRPSRLARAVLKASKCGWRRADAILTVSAHTRTDLERTAPRLAKRIRVIPNPLGANWFPDSGNRPGFADRAPEVLHVGSNERYKNRFGVLSIFAALPSALIESHRLVMAGAPPTDELLTAAEALKIEHRVDWQVRPDDAELKAAYQRARVLLFPSIYEGFGWPPLEAMANGCAVLCSDSGSLPEITGDAAWVCDITEPEAVAERLSELLTGAAHWAELTRCGQQRAQQYTEAEHALQLTSVYRAVLAHRRRLG